MANFVYTPTSLVLDIGGSLFTIRFDNGFRRKLDRLAEECAGRSGSDDPASDEFFAHLVNEILGDGATEKIFGCEIPDIYQSADVISFICDEFTAFQSSRMRKYSGSADAPEEGDPA